MAPGAVRTAFVLLGAIGNAVTGYLAGAAGWRVAYGVAAVLLLAAGLVAGDRLGGWTATASAAQKE